MPKVHHRLVQALHQHRAFRHGVATRRMSRRILIPIVHDRARRMIGMLTLVACLAGPIAAEASARVTVHLRPIGHSRVHGTAVATARGGGTRVVFSLYGLPARAHVRAVMQWGTCRRPSASFSTVGGGTADTGGRARWSAPLLFHGFHSMPIPLRTLTQGPHIFRVFETTLSGRYRRSGNEVCGAVPSQTTHHTSPRMLRGRHHR